MWTRMTALTLMLMAGNVLAIGNSNNRYAADWFRSFSPHTAMDMVERLPGFVLTENDGQVRGFAQAAGNLVINGQRPSTKNETLSTQLTRIPADRVEYLEVVAGETLGGEFRGMAQVANVVLRDASSSTTNLQSRLERATTDTLGTDLTLSHLRRSGDTTLSGSIQFREHPYPDQGTDSFRSAPGSDLLEFRAKQNDWRQRRLALAGSWERSRGERDNERLNLSYDRQADTLRQLSSVSDGRNALRSDTIYLGPRNLNMEIGGDFTRPFGASTLKLVALKSRHEFTTDDLVASYLPGRVEPAGLSGGGGQQVANRSGETVLRASWTQPRRQWTIEYGAEAAYNHLQSDLQVYSLNADGSRDNIAVPGAAVTVAEQRAELSVSGGRELPASWRLDLGLAAEFSRLSVRGDSAADRSLQYLKPNIAAGWHQGDWRLHLSVARSVAQLNFNDFASFAEISNDRITAGNSDLVPQQEWQFESSLERGFGDTAKVNLVLSAARVSQLQDRVPLAGGFDGPGNLGSGQRYGAELTLDTALDRLHIANARLRFNAYRQYSSVRDPYTATDRPFGNELPWHMTASFRQNFPAHRLAWGLSARYNGPFTSYLRNEIDEFRTESPFIDGFVEFRNSDRLTTELGVENMLDTAQRRYRIFYAPDRFVTAPAADELRLRHSGRMFYLRIKGELG